MKLYTQLTVSMRHRDKIERETVAVHKKLAFIRWHSIRTARVWQPKLANYPAVYDRNNLAEMNGIISVFNLQCYFCI